MKLKRHPRLTSFFLDCVAYILEVSFLLVLRMMSMYIFLQRRDMFWESHEARLYLSYDFEFQGYSSLAIALVLPESGRLVACERDMTCLEVAKRYYDRAGVSHKVSLTLQKCLYYGVLGYANNNPLSTKHASR